MRIVLAPAALIALAPSAVYAVTYLNAEQAARLMYQDADRFETKTLVAEGNRSVSMRIARKGSLALGYVVFDEVVGKTEQISYAVGVDADGSIKQLEILAYRESHGGEIRLPAWRKQFVGKTASAPLRVGEDIANISGATLSSTHITDGVRRILVALSAARRAGSLE